MGKVSGESLGKKRGDRRLKLPRVFSLKVEAEPSQIILLFAWCSKLRLTTGVKLAHCRDEFHEPRSDTVIQVALATKTTYTVTLINNQ
ncbi:hypothetical protein TNCV_450641 [Trichonephila clavipes]|nr:hypothetical protein TNCV_450641 [Trichonephila clavipes]